MLNSIIMTLTSISSINIMHVFPVHGHRLRSVLQLWTHMLDIIIERQGRYIILPNYNVVCKRLRMLLYTPVNWLTPAKGRQSE